MSRKDERSKISDKLLKMRRKVFDVSDGDSCIYCDGEVLIGEGGRVYCTKCRYSYLHLESWED